MVDHEMHDIFELNSSYSTTRRVIKASSCSEKKNPFLLFCQTEGKHGMEDGGLRKKGYLKVGSPNEPLVTVITVVFNDQECIEETIKSVINQTYSNVEYIIIDGGSNDATLAKVKKYEECIDYFMSEKDDGIYDAMNKGVRLASGKWVNFMNSGDQFHDNDVLKKVATKAFYGTDVLYGGATAVSSWGKLSINERSPEEVWKSFCHQSVFVKKQLLISDPFDKTYKLGADYNFIYRRFVSGCFFRPLGFPVAKVLYSNKGASATNELTSKMDTLRSILRNGDFKNDMMRHLGYHLVRFLINRGKYVIGGVSPEFLNFIRRVRDSRRLR